MMIVQTSVDITGENILVKNIIVIYKTIEIYNKKTTYDEHCTVIVSCALSFAMHNA